MTPASVPVLRCAGCSRELEIGDRFIEDTPAGFLRIDDDSGADDLMAMILGGVGGKIRYCEDCTQDGGDYIFETFYGDAA